MITPQQVNKLLNTHHRILDGMVYSILNPSRRIEVISYPDRGPWLKFKNSNGEQLSFSVPQYSTNMKSASNLLDLLNQRDELASHPFGKNGDGTFCIYLRFKNSSALDRVRCEKKIPSEAFPLLITIAFILKHSTPSLWGSCALKQ